MKKIEIKCNRKVRDYTISQLKAITGLSLSEAYELIRVNGSLPVAESSNIMKRGKQLLKWIDSFKFPSSIPVRLVDNRHLWQFRERWKKHLHGLLDKIVGSSKPVYLIDEVNKYLRRRKSKITCTRIHLMWFLDMYGMEYMKPENVASAIIKFSLSDWSQVLPLENNSKYTISLADSIDEVDPEEFTHMVEFIWAIPKPKIQSGLLTMLLDDIKVLQEFNKLWESAPSTYNYKKIIEAYVSRLQTLPPSKKRLSLKKEYGGVSLPDSEE